MKTVTSRDNPVLKAARKLRTRKGREEAGALLVEGEKLISEAVSAGLEIERVFIDAGALMRGEAAPGGMAEEIALEEKLFRELAGTVTPQPYIAVVKRPEYGACQRLRRWRSPLSAARNRPLDSEEAAAYQRNRPLDSEEAAAYHGPVAGGPVAGGPVTNDREAAPGGGSGLRVLVLDRVADPGNVGTMVRSALAAGMDGVWCVKGTADAFSDKAVRASAGAVFRIPVLEGLSAKDCAVIAKEAGIRLLTCNAGGKDLFEADLSGGIALVIGNESAGPQSVFLDMADAVIGIPMAEGAESLNAAAAAAVAMFEVRRQWIASSPLRRFCSSVSATRSSSQ